MALIVCAVAGVVGLNLLLGVQFWVGHRHVRRSEREFVPVAASHFEPRQGRHFRADVYESVAS